MNAVDPQFEALLIYLKEPRGFDCTGYKRSSLMRRVSRRMMQVEVPDYAEYLDYLQLHPDRRDPGHGAAGRACAGRGRLTTPSISPFFSRIRGETG